MQSTENSAGCPRFPAESSARLTSGFATHSRLSSASREKVPESIPSWSIPADARKCTVWPGRVGRRRHRSSGNCSAPHWGCHGPRVQPSPARSRTAKGSVSGETDVTREVNASDQSGSVALLGLHKSRTAAGVARQPRNDGRGAPLIPGVLGVARERDLLGKSGGADEQHRQQDRSEHRPQ